MVDDESAADGEVEQESTVEADRTNEDDAERPSPDDARHAEDEPGVEGTVDAFDRAAEEFLAIEAELLDDESDRGPATGTTRATVVGAERVEPEDVPVDYPVDVDDETVVALRLSTGDAETVAYFGWGDEDSRLARLLAVHGVDPESFADLNGRRLLVEAVDGYLVPVVPPARPTERRRWREAIVGAQVVNVLLLLVLLAPLGFPVGVAILLAVVVNLLVLPAATYLDGRYLETNTDWDHAPLFWGTFQAIPVFNAVVTAAYLWTRRNATPLAG